MSDKLITADCSNCESTYAVQYATELSAQEYPSFCPFCGEIVQDFSEEYIDDDHADGMDDGEWE